MEQLMPILSLIIMFALMYFVAIRPANKQRREQEVMMQNLEKGDSILTTSGFYGVVIDIMEEVVRAKFTQNPDLARKLADTGDALICEGNTWNDTFWGVDIRNGKGENYLGKILMCVRRELKNNDK